MIPGFSKCGTTTLCALLSEHPDIFIPRIKETNFFVQPEYDQKWDEFNAHFTELNNEKAIGEGTTLYSAYQSEKMARDRILYEYPDIRMIFIARNPIRRVESSYREFHHSGVNFGLNAPFGINNAIHGIPALISDSKYWERINNYREVLSDDRILVVFLEDLVTDHVNVLCQCFEFLGVETKYSSNIKLSKLNFGEEKLYDSNVLRWMRTNRFWGPKIAKLSPDKQNYLFHCMGLRRKFRDPIEWDEESLKILSNTTRADSEAFLKHYDKSIDYWPQSCSS